MSFIPLSQLRSFQATSRSRLPSWFKVDAKTGPDYLELKQTVERLKLHTLRRSPLPQSMGMLERPHRDFSHPRRHLHQTLPLLFS